MSISYIPRVFLRSHWFVFWSVAAFCSTESFTQTRGVLREVYEGIGGNSVSDLTNHPNFPVNPTSENVLTDFFEAPINVLESYGQRLRALLEPPATGNYTFWISSDDGSALYLSTDDTPSNKREIASVPGWTNSREWAKYPTQQSAPVSLVAGRRYYIEALMKEGTGGDNLAVRWQLPNGTMEEPIPASRLTVYGLGPPQITQQPASATVAEGGAAAFTVQLSKTTGAAYQWQRDGVDIPNAMSASYSLSPVALTDHGRRFRCLITNPQGSVTSSEATLSVTPDTTPPTIASVLSLGNSSAITVVFSEPVEAASGLHGGNYSLNQGATVNSAGSGTDTRSVVLNTSPLNNGVNYTLTIQNVRDRAATPNTIAANSQYTFRLDLAPLDAGVLRGTPESLGPSSRRTALAITEIMYNPPARADGRNLEFIELYNSDATPENISGYKLSGAVDFTFPPNTTIAARGFLVVAPAPADLQTVYGLSGVLGGFTNSLPNNEGRIRLHNRAGAVLLSVNYADDPPWPVAADNTGHSLVLARPTYGEADPRAWAASDVFLGTPGAAETQSINPYRSVVLNEFLAHTDDPELDFIELYNYSNQPVGLSGCILTDDASTNRFIIPAGTTIPALGFLSFNQTQLGFALNAAGETIYLIDPNRTRVIDAVRFPGQANGVSSGRSPDGAPSIHPLTTKTPGAGNGPLLISDVVINEIMYHPLSGDKDDEYIELHNKGAAAVNLGGWRLNDGVRFTFPDNFMIPANGFVVVAENAARLLTNYANLNSQNTVGNYQGALANDGERIVLTRPEPVIGTNNNQVVTNIIQVIIDEVTYGEGGRWGKWADGGGSSLELIDPAADNRLASNWADSDETTKAGWTTVQTTGVLDHGSGVLDELQFFLQGAGECLVDNVEVLNSSGVNLVPNSTFEAGLSGWVLQGNQDRSVLANNGFSSSRSLHLRALGRGDPGANRVRMPLTAALSANLTATIRAQVRWLRGTPEILFRLHGNHLEAIGTMSVPPRLGTPGARNSQVAAAPNAGPAIHGVTHSPVLPAANQPVQVRAQVHDPHGVGSLHLHYRIDPSADLTRVSMTYNGAGFYTAIIPGQPAGALVAFHIQAADNFNPSAATRFPNDAPGRECLIRFGEPQPAGSYGTYRIWMTKQTFDRWSSRLKLDNSPLDTTFVYGNQRVVYNMNAHYGGSPWVRPSYNTPTGTLCTYVMEFAPDERVLGAKDFVLDWPIRDPSAQLEQIAYWIAQELGVPYNHRRFIHLYVNGVKRGQIFEDTQQPNSDVVEALYPNDADGELLKLEDWFEFDDNANKEQNVDASLQNFTTTGGVKKLARYRWNWRKRATDAPNDYADLFALVDAVNTQGAGYTAAVASLVEVEEWMRIFAVEHIVGNWDSYGYNRGKNMYTYKPQNGKWIMLMWDIDFVLGASSDGPTTSMFNVIDPTITRMYNHPPFRRAYYRAWQDAVNGPLVSTTVGPVMDAKYSALLANGVSATSPATGKNYIASRRDYLLQQLASVAANFAATSNSGNNFSTDKNLVSLTGTAPIEVKTIKINGVAYPVTWTTVTAWTLDYALAPGANALTIQGYDLRGNALGNSLDTITVIFTGGGERPQDFVVINEIMYNPAVPNAAFVEIHNQSANSAFDLSQYRLEGADFAFPDGTVIQPGGFLIIANDAAGFAAAYRPSPPIAGVLNGRLDDGGETLKLVKPGATPDQDVVIDEVSFDDDAPWPAAADGFGPSLQLTDPQQDNNRVANWAAVVGTGGSSAQNLIGIAASWKYEQSGADLGTAWKDSGFNDNAWPSGPGLLYVETSALSAPKNTALTLGRTTYYFRTRFNFSGDPAGAILNLSTVLDDGAIFYLNGAEVLRLGMPADAVAYSTFASRTIGEAAYEGPFTISTANLRSGENVLAVEVHQVNATSSDIVFGVTLDSRSNAGAASTPGAANSVRATLPAFPLVWLNEVQSNNSSDSQDRLGDRDPWVELYNSGGTAINLSGYYLSDNYTNLSRWAFPANTTINARQHLVVWLDGEPEESSSIELHTNFRIPPLSGSVVLAQSGTGPALVVDYLNYRLLNADRSYGAFPDGTPAKRQVFYQATPAAANSNVYPPAPLFINEWMAGNTRSVTDLADGDYDDWFELFNAGPNAVDLSGYTLTDDLTNPNKWTIPAGTTIAPGKFLLFWADEETGQNNANNPDLHVNFKLGLSGEMIGLFAPDGTKVDSVTFGSQTNDVSQGRWPDGNAGPFAFLASPTPGSPNRLETTANSPPVISIIGNKTVDEGATLSFAVAADDSNTGQTLTFSLDAAAPAGATINPSTGVFTWTPTNAQGPANYPITVQVKDSGSPSLSDTESFTVTVNEVNSAPVLAKIGDKAVLEGSALNFTAVATDSDAPPQILRFSLEPGAPPGIGIDPSSGTVTWTPNEAQGPGIYSITVVVTDNGSPGLNAAETIKVAVAEVNLPPALAPISSVTITQGGSLSQPTSASDPDLPPQSLLFSLEPGAPAGMTINPNTGLINWTPSASQAPSSNPVIVRVTDNGLPALSDTKTFTVVVSASTPANSAPVLDPIADKSIDEESTLTFAVSATDSDRPAQRLTYSLEAGAPAGASINPETGAFIWRPSESQGPGGYTMTVRVTDDGSPSRSSSLSFKVRVNEVNAAPALEPIHEQSVRVGKPLTFISKATDADEPANALAFSLAAGAPAGASIDPQTGVFTWTPSSAQAPSTNRIQIVVSDNGSPLLTASQTVTVMVSAADQVKITDITRTPMGWVTLTWNAEPQQSYRVQYTENLREPWKDFGDPVTAIGPTAAKTDIAPTATQKFYRIVLAR